MRFNSSAILKILCQIVIIIGFSMVPSLGIAIFLHEKEMVPIFFGLIVIFLCIGFIGTVNIRPASNNLRVRDGFFLVGLTWLLASLLGTLPYLASGVFTSFPDALFESTAAFTTTGASILQELETLPRSLLFWRSLSQWLGGMGILIFIISILPALGISGQKIAKAEATGPILDKFTPKMSDSAKVLYLIYFLFTALCLILLLFNGMDLFDAFIYSFSSVSTGGLVCHSDGIAHFDSRSIELIISFFAIFSSVNFTLYYVLLRGRWKDFFRNCELQVFACLLLASTALISVNLFAHNVFDSVSESLHYAFVHVTAFITSAGYFCTNFDTWPAFSKSVLFVLAMIGGCSASTCGGLKIIRVIVLFRVFVQGLRKKLHPRAVIPVKVQDHIIPEETVFSIFVYFFLYLFTLFASALILSFQQIDLMSALSAVSALLNTTGTGFGLVGPTGNFAFFSPGLKLFLCILMLIGRLEMYAIIFLFIPSFWKPSVK